jgi:hypothetical protein
MINTPKLSRRCFATNRADPVSGGARSGPGRVAPAHVARRRPVRLGLVLWLLVRATPAHGQAIESVGTRALGMGGAFVAVADDATATWWNPAGLASGPFVSASVEYGQSHAPADLPMVGAAAQNRASGFAVAYPALGVSYYGVRLSEVEPAHPIAASKPDRQDQATGRPVLRSTATSALGATVGHSLGDHVVVATTIRLLRAGTVVSTDLTGAGSPELLDRADEIDVPRETHGDIDLGAMLRFRNVRVGGVVKHVAEPTIGEESDRLVVARQARVGVSLMKEMRGTTGVFDSLLGAVDVDLTETPTVVGAGRRVAVGGEAGLLRSRVLVRAGASADQDMLDTWSVATGASVAVRTWLFIDGAIEPIGRSRAGWSVSLRSSF